MYKWNFSLWHRHHSDYCYIHINEHDSRIILECYKVDHVHIRRRANAMKPLTFEEGSSAVALPDDIPQSFEPISCRFQIAFPLQLRKSSRLV